MSTPRKMFLTTLSLLLCLSVIPTYPAAASDKGAGFGFFNVGVSNFTGGLGGNLEVIISKNCSVFAGAGLLSVGFRDNWGWALGVKLYLDSLTNNSSYIGLGYGPCTRETEYNFEELTKKEKTLYGPSAIIGYRSYFGEHFNLSLGIGGSYLIQRSKYGERFLPALEITIGCMF